MTTILKIIKTSIDIFFYTIWAIYFAHFFNLTLEGADWKRITLGKIFINEWYFRLWVISLIYCIGRLLTSSEFWKNILVSKFHKQRS